MLVLQELISKEKLGEAEEHTLNSMCLEDQGIPYHTLLFPAVYDLIYSLVSIVAKPNSAAVPLSILATILNVAVPKGSQGTIFQCFLCSSNCILVAAGFVLTFSIFCDSASWRLLFAPLIDGPQIKIIEKDQIV